MHPPLSHHYLMVVARARSVPFTLSTSDGPRHVWLSLQIPRGASKSKPLRYEVSQRELEDMMRAQG